MYYFINIKTASIENSIVPKFQPTALNALLYM